MCAGIVEAQRKRMMPTGEPIINEFANQSYNASELNALIQFPQLTFGGLAEALVRIAGTKKLVVGSGEAHKYVPEAGC